MKTPGTESAIVIGGAPTVWEEVAEALELAGGTADRIAVNWSGVLYPGPVHWWVTHHPEMVPDFIRRRVDKGYPMDGCTVVATAPAPGVDLVVPDKFLLPGEPSGSSALFGALLGCLHYHRVYVCGVTLANTTRPEHIATTEAPGVPVEREYNQYIPGWESAIAHDRHGITSKVIAVRDGKLRMLLERNGAALRRPTEEEQ